MYKSFDRQTEEEIVILDPYWDKDTIPPIRERGRENHLACPVCQQPVHVKAGEKKRWHFAHKDLSNCPLKHESPNILQARSLLYNWLKIKVGDRVTIEKDFPEAGLPRPLDCYLEIRGGGKIGYWVLERGIRDRLSLLPIFRHLNVHIIWVMLTDMLRFDDADPETIHLTPTERDFLYSSEYNKIYSGYDSALCYLSIDEQTVTTLRGLSCIHSPQKYGFDFKLKTKLEHMLLSPRTGEFVHPGEHERLEEQRQQILEEERLKVLEERKRQEEIRESQRQRLKQQEILLKRARVPNQTESSQRNLHVPKKHTNSHNHKQGAYSSINRPYPCSVCGTQTVNWTTLDLSNDTCICSRECLTLSQKARKR